MNPQPTTPAPPTSTLPNENRPLPLRIIRNFTRSTQQTMWNFLHTSPNATNSTANPVQAPIRIPTESQTTLDSGATPPSTPLTTAENAIQNPSQTSDALFPTVHQQPLRVERRNEPWGDSWAMEKPTSLFRVLSKNTGTINLLNLDMQAITKELNQVHASVFAAQETNVNWDVDSRHQLVTQC